MSKPNTFYPHIDRFSDCIAAARWQGELLLKNFTNLLGEARRHDFAARGLEIQDMPSEYHDFSIPQLPDGTSLIFSETIGGAGREGRLSDTLNTLLQWLAVSCFEAYESLLKDLYAQLGVGDATSWHPKDRRKLLCNNDSAEFALRRQALRDCSYPTIELFNRLRTPLRDLEKADQHYNCRFTILLHSELRHSIVHRGGIVHVEDVRERIGSDLGRAISAAEERRFMSFLDRAEHSDNAAIRMRGPDGTVGPWKSYLLDTAYQGALVYWSACKTSGLPIGAESSESGA